MDAARKFIQELGRPNEGVVVLNSVDRVATVRSETLLIGLRYQPERDAAKLRVIAANSVGVIPEDGLGDSERLRRFLERTRLSPTSVERFPLNLFPSPDVQRIYVANLRLDFIVPDPSQIDISVSSPAALAIEYFSVRTDIKGIVEVNYSINGRRR